VVDELRVLIREMKVGGCE